MSSHWKKNIEAPADCRWSHASKEGPHFEWWKRLGWWFMISFGDLRRSTFLLVQRSGRPLPSGSQNFARQPEPQVSKSRISLSWAQRYPKPYMQVFVRLWNRFEKMFLSIFNQKHVNATCHKPQSIDILLTKQPWQGSLLCHPSPSSRVLFRSASWGIHLKVMNLSGSKNQNSLLAGKPTKQLTSVISEAPFEGSWFAHLRNTKKVY